MQPQTAIFLAVGQIHHERTRRRAQERADAVAVMHVHITERRRGIARVEKYTHAEQVVEIMHVFNAGHRQRGRPDNGVAAWQTNTVIAIPANRTCAAGAKPEIFRQAIGLRPDLTHLGAESQNIALADRPPLLRP